MYVETCVKEVVLVEKGGLACRTGHYAVPTQPRVSSQTLSPHVYPCKQALSASSPSPLQAQRGFLVSYPEAKAGPSFSFHGIFPSHNHSQASLF